MTGDVTLAEVIQNTRVLPIGELQKYCDVANSRGVPLEEVLEHERVFSPAILESLKRGLALIKDGTITMEKLAVAMFDQMTTQVDMMESLEVRGWLPKG
jgi:hypothetical protein